MKIQYRRNGVRIWDEGHVWDKSNGNTLEISDAELAANLLTYPANDFKVAADDPLMVSGLTEDQIIGLALCGFASLDQAHAMSVADMKRVADTWQVNVTMIKKWLGVQDQAVKERATRKRTGDRRAGAIIEDAEEA